MKTRYKGKNIDSKQFGALSQGFKDMTWDFDCDEGPPKPKMITDGPRVLDDDGWKRVSEIISKMEVVDKEGSKKYEQLIVHGAKGLSGSRLLNEMEDTLTHLDDQKTTMQKMFRFKKNQDCNLVGSDVCLF